MAGRAMNTILVLVLVLLPIIAVHSHSSHAHSHSCLTAHPFPAATLPASSSSSPFLDAAAAAGGGGGGGAACPINGACDTPQVRDATVVRPLRVLLSLHVFCTTNGSCPGDVSIGRVTEMLNRLNKDYAPLMFQFTLKSQLIHFHNDSRWAPFMGGEADLALMAQTFSIDTSSTINLFIAQSYGGWERASGMATFPWNVAPGAVWVNSETFNQNFTVLQHEMGHALGLLHVFQGADDDCTSSCLEVCDRTTADMAGDLCSDTAATDLITDCTALPRKDCESNFCTPATHNWMNYSLLNGCQTGVTPQQMRRMHCWICAARSGVVEGC